MKGINFIQITDPCQELEGLEDTINSIIIELEESYCVDVRIQQNTDKMYYAVMLFKSYLPDRGSEV